MAKESSSIITSIREIHTKLDDQTEKINNILVQATKTNGRVNALEERKGKVDEILEKVSEETQSYKYGRYWLGVVGTTVLAIVYFSFSAVINNLKEELKTDIRSTIKEDIRHDVLLTVDLLKEVAENDVK